MEVTKPKICGSVKWLHCIFLKAQKQQNCSSCAIFLKKMYYYLNCTWLNFLQKNMSTCALWEWKSIITWNIYVNEQIL